MGTSSKALLFFFSYYDALQDLKPMQRLEAYDAIFRYGFFGIDPNPSKAFSPVWKVIKPIIDSSIKKRDDGLKGGRPQKTSGFNDGKTTGCKTEGTTGTTTPESNKNKKDNKNEKGNKEKELEEPPPPRRTKKEPQAAVFQSLPSSPDRIGYAATEELRKRQIKRIEQAAEQTTAQPPTPKEDAETAELKKAFRESTGQEQSTAPAEQPQPSPG